MQIFSSIQTNSKFRITGGRWPNSDKCRYKSKCQYDSKILEKKFFPWLKAMLLEKSTKSWKQENITDENANHN